MAKNDVTAGGIAGPNESGIYSDDGRTRVNERSYGVSTPGRNVAVATAAALVLLGVATVGWFFVLKPMRDANAEKPVEVKAGRQVFDNTALPFSAPQPVATAADCPVVTLTQANGQPLIGVDGRPVTVDCKGKASSQVPAPSSTLYQGSAASGGAAKPPPSPYRGGVILKNDTVGAASIGVPQLPALPDLSALQGLIKARTGGGGLAASGGGEGGGDAPRNVRGAVGGMLNATVTGDARAGQLKAMPYLLPKGRQIDCALTTRVISEVSGFASCVLTSNVYSVDGKTLLLERGSEVDGEYQAGMRRGQRRLFVLWNRVRTPNGVFVNLASPNSDALGTMGLPGYVDNKWFERIGSAFLLSIVQDAISASIGDGSVTREYDENGNIKSETDRRKFSNTENTASRSVEMVLAEQLGIQPTLYANQGDRISIYVARDVNFEDVYVRR